MRLSTTAKHLNSKIRPTFSGKNRGRKVPAHVRACKCVDGARVSAAHVLHVDGAQVLRVAAAGRLQRTRWIAGSGMQSRRRMGWRQNDGRVSRTLRAAPTQAKIVKREGSEGWDLQRESNIEGYRHGAENCKVIRVAELLVSRHNV